MYKNENYAITMTIVMKDDWRETDVRLRLKIYTKATLKRGKLIKKSNLVLKAETKIKKLD